MSSRQPYKQRFKGVENFLRRVAFNLGNTPSQTEVKIISCIPIDVTDLQHKIQLLERQLQELSKVKGAKLPPTLKETKIEPAAPEPAPEPAQADDKSMKPNKGDTIVNTALFGDSFSGHARTVSYYSDNSLWSSKTPNKPTESGCSGRNKSNVSFVLPKMSTSHKNEEPSREYKCHDDVDLDIEENEDGDKVDTYLTTAERYYMSLFKKRKKKRVPKGGSNPKTQLVYFAQHDQSNPFNKKAALDHTSKLNENTVSISHAYLDKVMRKQYDPKFATQEFSDTSHFSKPVCRDTTELLNRSCYESDICSCCHGEFQNIDHYMPKGFESINKITKYTRNITNKTYYDSNLYDVVPVRENTNKFSKEINFPEKEIEIKCWPEQFRSKYRYEPKTVIYQAVRQPKRSDKISFEKIRQNKMPEQYFTKQKRANVHVQETIKETSEKSNAEFCGNNKNLNYPLPKFKRYEPIQKILLKNEYIETDGTNTKLVSNQSTQLELIPDENKMESALNQIKSILQSVLAEVKSNPKDNSTLEKTSTKDAIVQKGASQNNMQGQSTLLHSYTYNHSYNANPHLVSCSRQASAGQYCLAGVPYHPSLKYLQNFPVFVHPSRKRLCACYYKNSSDKCSKYKLASVAATSKEKEIQHTGNKETEKLIKEIYKSMALTMDFPAQDNSVSECDDLKSAENQYSSENIEKDVKNAETEIEKRDIEVGALISSNVTSQSEDKVRVTEARSYSDSTEIQPSRDRILYKLDQHSSGTIVEDDQDTNDAAEDTEDEDVDIKEYETAPKMTNKSLLQRMLRSVNLFKKKKVHQKVQNDYEKEVTVTSDSDDYETIYSGLTVVVPPKHGRLKTRSMRNATDRNEYIKPAEKVRRSPYLEQEYRRQWHEQMMFNKRAEKKYSSERPLTKQTPQKNDRIVYWNNYEARSAIVKHNLPRQLECVKSHINLAKKIERGSPDSTNEEGAKDKLGWAKKYKPRCGEQWKKFLLEN